MSKQLDKKISHAMRYAAAPGAPYSDDEANSIVAPEFDVIRQSGKPLTPDTIIERAQDEDSGLNKFFDWDDTVAAPKWRRHQAMTLANHLIIIEHNESGVVARKAEFNFSVRENVDSPAQRQYFSFEMVDNDPILKARLLESAMRELRTFSRKYRTEQLPQLEPVFELVDQMTK